MRSCSLEPHNEIGMLGIGRSISIEDVSETRDSGVGLCDARDEPAKLDTDEAGEVFANDRLRLRPIVDMCDMETDAKM